jgi:L-iditol 2-dehydrogenase
MRAAYLVGSRKLEVREVPAPVAPEDGLVLEVKACGVCGSDIRRWKEGPQGGDVIPGHEVTGVVSEVGSRVTRFKPGDRLAVAPDVHCGHCYYCQHGMYNLCDDLRFVGITPGYGGGFAERLLLSGEVLAYGIVHHMPGGLTFVDGSLGEPCSSVLAAHDRAGTGLDDVVLVIGAGPIGCLHAVVAQARGARAIVSEPSEQRRAMAAQFGPEAIVDPFHEDLASVVFGRTGGLGADIVVCANPVAATQTQAVEIVRKGGRVVLFGGLPKANPMVTLDANRIHYGEIEVVGAFSYHPTMHQLALDLLARQVIPADLLVTHIYPLDRIAEAFETAASGQGLKVVVAAE